MKRPQLTYAPDLQLTDAEFHALHQRADGRAKRVSVDGEALRHLLHDHSALHVRLEEVEQHLRHPDQAKPLSNDPLVKEQRRGKRRSARIELDPLSDETVEAMEDLIG